MLRVITLLALVPVLGAALFLIAPLVERWIDDA